jgi:hypothetical protein
VEISTFVAEKTSLYIPQASQSSGKSPQESEKPKRIGHQENVEKSKCDTQKIHLPLPYFNWPLATGHCPLAQSPPPNR